MTDVERPRALLRWPTYLMGQLHRAGVGRIDEILGETGMSLRDYYVLACIDEGGGLAQQQVANRLSMDRSDLVKLLDRLEDAGWVIRQRDAVDRRRHILTITDAGRVAVAKVEEVSTSVTGELLGRLSRAEQQTLQRLLRKALGE